MTVLTLIIAAITLSIIFVAPDIAMAAKSGSTSGGGSDSGDRGSSGTSSGGGDNGSGSSDKASSDDSGDGGKGSGGGDGDKGSGTVSGGTSSAGSTGDGDGGTWSTTIDGGDKGGFLGSDDDRMGQSEPGGSGKGIFFKVNPGECSKHDGKDFRFHSHDHNEVHKTVIVHKTVKVNGDGTNVKTLQQNPIIGTCFVTQSQIANTEGIVA
jgi:hypothetical protein